MLIMPFIFDSGYLFSASKALDISSSDAGMLTIFPRALSNNYVIYRQPSFSILWLKKLQLASILLQVPHFNPVSNYPATG